MIVLIIILAILWSVILSHAIKNQQSDQIRGSNNIITPAEKRCPPHKWTYVEVPIVSHDEKSLNTKKDNTFTYIQCTVCKIIPK